MPANALRRRALALLAALVVAALPLVAPAALAEELWHASDAHGEPEVELHVPPATWLLVTLAAPEDPDDAPGRLRMRMGDAADHHPFVFELERAPDRDPSPRLGPHRTLVGPAFGSVTVRSHAGGIVGVETTDPARWGRRLDPAPPHDDTLRRASLADGWLRLTEPALVLVERTEVSTLGVCSACNCEGSLLLTDLGHDDVLHIALREHLPPAPGIAPEYAEPCAHMPIVHGRGSLGVLPPGELRVLEPGAIHVYLASPPHPPKPGP